MRRQIISARETGGKIFTDGFESGDVAARQDTGIVVTGGVEIRGDTGARQDQGIVLTSGIEVRGDAFVFASDMSDGLAAFADPVLGSASAEERADRRGSSERPAEDGALDIPATVFDAWDFLLG